MDVIEEESFFKWKEDVSQEFPGKGQALFQVLCCCLVNDEWIDVGARSKVLSKKSRHRLYIFNSIVVYMDHMIFSHVAVC